MLAASGTTCCIIGIFVQFVMGTFLDWRTVALFNIILPVITISALFFVPESPHWLLVKGRDEEARDSLCWLRGWVPFHCVETEFNIIYESLTQKRNETLSGRRNCAKRFAPYKKRGFLRPFGLISLLLWVGHFSGQTPLQTYAVQVI